VLANFTVSPIESGAEGALTYGRGTYARDLVRAGRPPEHLTGSYLLVFQRQTDARWRIQIEMVSRDRPHS
jgi:ketosteroid isomerase-like protein